jgi:hypothetical protein
VNVETLKMRINRLKHLIADCPSGIDAPEEIRHILETSPQVLKDAENALQSNDPMLFEQLHEALERTEVFVTWATATIKGQGHSPGHQEWPGGRFSPSGGRSAAQPDFKVFAH